MLERVSSQVIVLDPPEKLVIETRASGGYRQFDWQRNGNPFTLTQGQPFAITLQEFPNFFEVFVRESTTTNDLGVYEVDLALNTGPQVPELQFLVTPYSKYIYKTLCVCVCVFFCVFFSHTCNLQSFHTENSLVSSHPLTPWGRRRLGTRLYSNYLYRLPIIHICL